MKHVFRYLTDSQLLSRIGEFQSFDFHRSGSGQVIAALIVAIAGGALALARRRYDRFLLAMLFSAMALRSARALPLAALVLLPLANAELGHVTAPWQSRLWGSGYSGRLRKIDAQWSGLALTPLILLCAWLLLRPLPAGFPRLHPTRNRKAGANHSISTVDAEHKEVFADSLAAHEHG